jgi:hypothetical protein
VRHDVSSELADLATVEAWRDGDFVVATLTRLPPRPPHKPPANTKVAKDTRYSFRTLANAFSQLF